MVNAKRNARLLRSVLALRRSTDLARMETMDLGLSDEQHEKLNKLLADRHRIWFDSWVAPNLRQVIRDLDPKDGLEGRSAVPEDFVTALCEE